MPILRLELRASRALAAVVLLFHGLAAAGILLVAPGLAGGALAALVASLGAAAAWDRALLRGAQALRVLELGSDGAATAALASGLRLPGRPGARCHVGPWWVVLPLAGSRRHAVVVQGMLTADEFRRLRLWALWGRLPAAARAAGAG